MFTMPPSLLSKPEGTTTRDMDIKREEGDSPESQLREEPSAPLTNSMTSNAMRMTTLESSRDSSLSSVRYDLIKNEDDVSHAGNARPMRTRQTSRLATATLVSSSGVNPEVPPQVRSDVEQSESKGRATTTHHEPSSGEDSQEDCGATEVKRQLRQTRAQLRKQNVKVSSAERIVRQLREDLKKEREKVKSKRDEYQKKIKSGPITMGDDGQMRTLLSRLGDMCKDWAAKYAIPDEAGRKYNDAETSNILNLLKVRYNAVSDHGEAKIFDGMTNCAELLLNTALTHLVWFEILNRPFYFVEHARKVEAPAGIEEALKWLVQLGDCSGEVAQKLTYCWLGTLLKTLNPTSTLEAHSQAEKAARSKNKTMKDAAFRGLEDLLKRHCGLLLNEVTDKEAKQRDGRLWHIFRQAHELSYKLWTQGYKIKCFGRTSRLAQFKNKDSLMQAHLTMLIDGTDASRDGQEVYLVTKPYVKAFGNENGEFAEAIRPLNPATVCIATNEDLEQATRDRSEEAKKQDHSFARNGTITNDSQQAAQKNKQGVTEDTIGTPGTKKKKKQKAASGISEAGASLTNAGDNAAPKTQAHPISFKHGTDPEGMEPSNGTPSPQIQNSNTTTPVIRCLAGHEVILERVNLRTGKRKRLGNFLELIKDGEDSTDSSVDDADGEEPPSKKQRSRKRNRSGPKQAANKLETPGKLTATVQVRAPGTQKSLRAGASKMLQGDLTFKK